MKVEIEAIGLHFSHPAKGVYKVDMHVGGEFALASWGEREGGDGGQKRLTHAIHCHPHTINLNGGSFVGVRAFDVEAYGGIHLFVI